MMKMLERLPLFGFSRWDVHPERDEGSHQFFRRMVDLEGEENIAFFNFVNGLRDTSLNSQETLDFLLRYPFPDEVRRHLQNSTIYDIEKDFEGHRSSTRMLRGQHFKRGDLVAHRRRWCPACVAEKPYLRLWFDVEAIGHCPYHGLSLIDRPDGDKPIPWYRSGLLELTNFEFDRPKRRLRSGSFGHYVLGRLGCEEPLPHDILDGATLADVIDASALVGIMVSRDWQPDAAGDASHDEIETGFRLLRKGSEKLAAAFHAWMDKHVPKPVLAQNAEDIFAWAYVRSSNDCGTLGPWVRDAMRVAVAIHRTGRLQKYTSPGMLSIGDLVRRYGLREEAISTLLKEERFVEADLRRRRPITESQLPEIDKVVAALIDTKEFARILGLPLFAHRQFINAGIVRQYRGRIYGKAGPFFRIEDVVAIRTRLRSLPCRGRREYAHAFRNAARLAKCEAGVIAVKVIKGEIDIFEVKDAAKGFLGLVVDTERRLRRKPRAAGDKEIMLTDICSILKITKTTSRALLKSGHLKPIGERAGRQLFNRTEVERFARSHVCEYPFRKAAGISAWRFAEAMTAAKVKPILKFDNKLVHNTIYRRADVMKALRLDVDPLEFHDEAVDRFWKAVMKRVAERLPNLRIPRAYPKLGCWAATAYKPRVVRFRFDETTRTMFAELAPLKQGEVFVFPVDAVDYDSDVNRLFDVLSAISVEQIAAHAEIARDRRQRRARGE